MNGSQAQDLALTKIDGLQPSGSDKLMDRTFATLVDRLYAAPMSSSPTVTASASFCPRLQGATLLT